jgi:type I restriction enzyme S subunit
MRTTTFRDVLLEEIAEIKSGVGFPISMQGCESGDFPFAKVGDISNRARSGEQFISDAPNWVKNEDLSTLKFTPFPTGTIVFAKIGEAIRQNFRAVSTRPMLFDNNVMGVIPQEERVDTTYLYFYLRTLDFYHLAGKTTVPAIRKSTIEKLKIPLPPLEEQRRIAAILDKADGVRRKRKEAIRLTEELLKSTFLEMFGDPVTNPKGWEVIGLGKISQIQGGLQVTPARKELPLEVPYLRVANVYRDKLLLDEIKNIRVTSSELERINMKAGDILIVEGHGNKEEIGRSSVWDGSIENCVHQNHLIRVRLDPNKAEPIYISAYLNSAGGRCQLTKFGKTTSGLNTISTSNVKATKVLCPPIEMQKRYLDFQRKLTEAKNASVQHLEQSENLFNSLLQRAFRGEL